MKTEDIVNLVNCRIGSLEICIIHILIQDVVNCRIGSLETLLGHAGLTLVS